MFISLICLNVKEYILFLIYKLISENLGKGKKGENKGLSLFAFATY